MIKLHFTIEINATPEQVWAALWTIENYHKWTSVFGEGSTVKSDWEQGSNIYFVDGKGNGMYSVIETKITNRQMTFKHLGEIMDGVEKESSWSGSLENYVLTEANGITNLQVDLDSTEEFQEYFQEKFPQALQFVKKISES